MPHSLRRSCSACARSKHSCDLRTPRCTRCVRRNVQCVYANEPLAAWPAPSSPDLRISVMPAKNVLQLTDHRLLSLDPFDSYPQTRLSRDHTHRLVYNFLSKIAFQYYPLDLSCSTNPFLISWWPLALGDPALFHVSLQTASLDEELLAQRGFETSELLMADSVALIRRKVEDSALAIRDGTMNSVITLAAIEFGKGNLHLSDMHVRGAKRLVELRGGINAVRQTSPLTARMISWVSMITTGRPQFETQNDYGLGNGIPPIAEWYAEPTSEAKQLPGVNMRMIAPPVKNVLLRLRNVFQSAQQKPLTPTKIHDLSCFVVHRLLSWLAASTADIPSAMTECFRYSIILYMFLLQGPTYYSHAVMLNEIVERLCEHMERLELSAHDPADVWFISVGMAAASGTSRYPWLARQAQDLALGWKTRSWSSVLSTLEKVLWLGGPHNEGLFRLHWEWILGHES